MNRRDLLKTGVFAGAAVALPTARFVGAATANRMPEANLPKPYKLEFKQAPVAKPYRRDASADYYKFDQVAAQVEIIPGYKTWVFAYQDTVTGVASVPGPTIKALKGRPAVVRHCNKLPAAHPVLGYTPWTSTHLHGSDSAPQYDGYASDITMPPGGVYPEWLSPTEQRIAGQRGRVAGTVCVNGEYKDYHYPNDQPARTLWYHDHGVHHTAENAYHGMLGQYHLYDDNEQYRLAQGLDPVTKVKSIEKGLGLPTTIYDRNPASPETVTLGSGDYDVALSIGDLMFQSDGNLLFSLDNQSGHWGDVIHVNGVPWPVMKVRRRKYRFRILTAAISRSYNFSINPVDTAQANFGKNFSYQVIGCDGGLAPAPVTVKNHRQLGGERYEIVVDFGAIFKGKVAGSRVELNNLSPKNNINYTNTHKVMAFEVVGDEKAPGYDQTLSKGNGNNVPLKLDPVSDIMNLTPAMSVATRELRLERSNGAWTVNGTTWDHIIASDFKYVEASPMIDPAKGYVVETWNIVNKSGGWFHPTHIHLVDFKVIARNGTGRPLPHECGPKDVVYAGENETITLLVKFNKLGKYMVHCHNLVHEDHDMMTQFEVVAKPDALGASAKGDDPMEADPAQDMQFEGDL